MTDNHTYRQIQILVRYGILLALFFPLALQASVHFRYSVTIDQLQQNEACSRSLLAAPFLTDSQAQQLFPADDSARGRALPAVVITVEGNWNAKESEIDELRISDKKPASDWQRLDITLAPQALWLTTPAIVVGAGDRRIGFDFIARMTLQGQLKNRSQVLWQGFAFFSLYAVEERPPRPDPSSPLLTAGIFEDKKSNIALHAEPVKESPPLDVSGRWTTEFGTLTLRQTGSAVEGEYTYHQGKIQGTLNGQSFKGRWSEAPSYTAPDDAGDIELNFNTAGTSFNGKWRNGFGSVAWNLTSWNGSRKSPAK